MTEQPTKTEVVDNELEDRFEIWHGDHLAGFADYRRRAGATIFVHTEIADEFGGKGLGSVLARHALDATVARGEPIVPVCPFISAYLRKPPQSAAHVRWPATEAAAPADSAGPTAPADPAGPTSPADPANR